MVSAGACASFAVGVVDPVKSGSAIAGVALAVDPFWAEVPEGELLWEVPDAPKNMQVASVSAKADDPLCCVLPEVDGLPEVLDASSSRFAFADRTLLVEFTILRCCLHPT